MPAKKRLDILLVERGLAESREKSKAIIMAGQVMVSGQVQTKPSAAVLPDVKLEIKSVGRFVGRGGEKLEAAFSKFALDVGGLICLDVGASTGGFTDCLLQRGAKHVYCVDVGKGQLHWKLRNDPRVTVYDELNARYMKPGIFPEKPAFSVVDVSFISLTKILPAVIAVMRPKGGIVSLIKPQFEAGREQVGRGGVVRDEAVRRKVVENIRRFGTRELGLEWAGVCESPLRGPAGNVEFLACWRKI